MNDIIVDVIKDTGNKIIVSQNDNLTKTYKLIVTKNNARYDLSNKKVRFAFLKNGTNLGDIIEELNISDATNGIVDFPITSTITRENGTFTCGLAIFNDSGYMENTAFFNMLVKESLFEKISGELVDEGAYGQILSLLEKGEKLQKNLESLVDRSEVVTPKLENLVPRAEAITQPLQNAVQDAESKKPQLDASIESAKNFIENLDGSQNLPQMREDITALQNGLKTNQELAYEGHNLKCENTLDGRIEDIILEGMTYQNLAKISVLASGNKYENGIITLIANGTWGRKVRFDTSLVKPNTTYTIIVNCISNNTVNSNSYAVAFFNEISTRNERITFNPNETGLKTMKITSKTDLTGANWWIEPINTTTSGEWKGTVLILEGDYTNKYTPPYFEGIKSVSEAEENKVSVCSNDKESKETPKDKIEYKLPFDGGLKGLSDGTKDLIYNKDDGSYVLQKIGKTVITENTNIDMVNNYNTLNTLCFTFTIPNKKKSKGQYELFNGICSNFKNGDWFSVYNAKVDEEMIAETVDQANEVYIKILKNKLETQDVAGFKKWLQSNPVTVYYELAEPIETKLSDTKLSLDTYNDLTYVFSNNAISPNIKLKVASNLGSIIQQNSQSINDIYKLIDEVIIPQLTTNSADIQVLKIK